MELNCMGVYQKTLLSIWLIDTLTLLLLLRKEFAKENLQICLEISEKKVKCVPRGFCIFVQIYWSLKANFGQTANCFRTHSCENYWNAPFIWFEVKFYDGTWRLWTAQFSGRVNTSHSIMWVKQKNFQKLWLFWNRAMEHKLNERRVPHPKPPAVWL